MMNKTDYQASLTPDRAEDGKTHINVHYNFANTSLGRMLSTYYVSAFEHPYFGRFKCIEGFWLFVKLGCRDDTFRAMTGVKARSYYKALMNKEMTRERDVPNAEQHLLIANWVKLQANTGNLRRELNESVLPFDQYYLFGAGKVPIRPVDWKLTVDVLTKLREASISGNPPESPTDDQYAQLIVRL